MSRPVTSGGLAMRTCSTSKLSVGANRRPHHPPGVMACRRYGARIGRWGIGRGADMADQVDALVIFGATGDLAKLETFPALVGLVERGVLAVPVVGVAKSGWGLEQFRNYAVASLKLNNIDSSTPAATKMLSLLRYVDGDLGDDATYQAMSQAAGPGKQLLFYFEVPAFLFGRIAQGIATAGRAGGARVMVEKPF